MDPRVDDIIITLKDGTTLRDEHEQDCCEEVYIAWPDDIQDDLNNLGVTFDTIDIEFVEDFGIKINGISVPCYNRQNGYYSDQLDLIIAKDGTELIISLDKNKAIKEVEEY